MLPEDKRTQLDGIVQQMVANNESDSNIKFVVDDFKTKYSTKEQPKPAKKDLLQKTTNIANKIFPGKQVGESIGTLAGLGITAAKEKLGKVPVGTTEGYDISAPTPLQVGGDIAAGAAQVAGAKIPGAKTIGGAAAQLGGLGSAGAAGTAIAEKKPVDKVISSAITAGAIGGALGAAGKLVSKGVSALTKKAPERIYNTAIKPTLNETRSAIKFNGETLGKDLIDRGVSGSDKKLLTTAQEELAKNEDKLQKVLSGSKQTIRRDELTSYLDDIIAKKSNTPGLSNEVENVKNVINEFPEEVTVSQANEIKRNIYSALNDVAFKLDANLTTKKEAMKALAKGIKTEIENKTADEVGAGVVKSINKELSVFGRLQDRAIDSIARANKNNLLGLGDIGTIGAGAVAAGAPGAIVAETVKQIAGSTAFKTNLAVKLTSLGKLIDKIPADSAGRINKSVLVNILSKIGKTRD